MGGDEWLTSVRSAIGPRDPAVRCDADAPAESLGAIGGSALGRTSQSEMWSWIPPGAPGRDINPESPANVVSPHHETEPPAAIFTCFSPPGRSTLRLDEVDEVLRAHAAAIEPRGPKRAAAATIPWPTLACHERLLAIVNDVNAAWWRLGLLTVTAYLLRYRAGDGHLEHTDMHPGSMQRKLSLSVQLSDSDDYTGGDLELRCWGDLLTMPRIRGSVIAFPGWTPHRVTPVERGERWVLVVWGWGRPVT